MAIIISKSAFAARRGVAISAVSNWIARGKIAGAALTVDGKILVEEAERQLAVSIDPGRGAPTPLALATTAAQTSAAAPPATESDPATDTLAALRIRKETLAVELAERNAAIARGELVKAAEAARDFARRLDELIAAFEQFVLDLPPKLGSGREGIDTARREFRAFRKRFADQAAAAMDLANAA